MPFAKSPAARRFTATVAAAATALALMTAAAVPARADSNDAAKALALIATVAIIGKALDDRNKRRDEPVSHPRRDVLPRVCAIQIDTGRRAQTVYSGPCLREEGVRARLPRQCEGSVRMRGRTVPVFAEACMIDAGFRVERGRDGRRDDRHHWDRRY